MSSVSHKTHRISIGDPDWNGRRPGDVEYTVKRPVERGPNDFGDPVIVTPLYEIFNVMGFHSP